MSGNIYIPKKLRNQLRAVRENRPTLWETHYRLATKRLLSSMFFFVSGKNAFEKGNKLLSAIGYYYTLFHLSKALLFLLPQHTIEELKGISHKRVLNMIETEFVKRKMLPRKFIEVLDYTRSIREAVNYNQDRWIGLGEQLKKNELQIIECFEHGVRLFKEICTEELWHVQTIIGDGIGDDWMDSYLSKKETQMLSSILTEHNLTT